MLDDGYDHDLSDIGIEENPELTLCYMPDPVHGNDRAQQRGPRNLTSSFNLTSATKIMPY